MTKKTLTVHTENILPIIKKWLYSDKDIFIRELVSNACDALNKCKLLAEKNEIEHLKDEDLRIDINIDQSARTLKFIDTGIGMTAEEIEKYIAQIAFSSAEEFLDHYKSDSEKDRIIGHFGLGFYSAYMVSSKVTIDTLSYKENESASFWSCDGSTEYFLEEGKRENRGTEITLFIDNDSDEFLEESRIRSILEQYCAFLPFPIYLNGNKINNKEPLWLKNASSCSEDEYLDFYHQLYPLDPDPVFWVHLNVDYPFHLRGILFFPKVHKQFEWNKSKMKLFCNRVFVSEDCKDLLPDYLMILRGAIDSPDIPLNVSRSYLQMDKTVRQLSSHISKKVADRLCSLFETEKEKFFSFWEDIEIIVKLGLLQDDKFYERVKNILVFKTTKDRWITAEEYLESNKELSKNKLFYTTSDRKDSHFLELYKEKNLEVLLLSSPVDTAVINFLEGKLSPAKFQRIDGGLDETILDESREKTLLDAQGKTEASKIADLIRANLVKENIQVEAKSLASDTLPGFIMIDENMRRMRDYLALSQQSIPSSLPDKKTFVVNTNNKIVLSLPQIQQKDPELAEEITLQLYELSLLSQKELEPLKLAGFAERSTKVLEKLISATSISAK